MKCVVPTMMPDISRSAITCVTACNMPEKTSDVVTVLHVATTSGATNQCVYVPFKQDISKYLARSRFSTAPHLEQ